MILFPRTLVTMHREQELTLGPFQISDRARSIRMSARRMRWPEMAKLFSARLEISADGGFSWKVAGGFGAEGGRVMRRGKVASENYSRLGLYPERARLGRVVLRSLRELKTLLCVENSVTIGAPASTDGFASSLSVAVDAGTGIDRVLVAGAWHNSQTFYAINPFQYNGIDVTAISGAIGTSGTANCYLYRQVAPATGSHTLDLLLTGVTDCAIGGVPLFGVDQTTPAQNGTGTTGTGSPVTVDVTSATGNLVVDIYRLTHTSGGSTTAVGADQTAQIDRENYDGAKSWGMSTEAGAATSTMSWTGTNAGGWIQAGASFQPAAGAEIQIPHLPLDQPYPYRTEVIGY